MAHIHELIDFTVSAYIVHQGRLLLVHHKLFNEWFPVGGHIELDEDPEQALFREIREESGLIDVEIIGEPPPDLVYGQERFLPAPQLLTVHPAGEGHQHIDLVYFLKAHSAEVTLATAEHHDIRWFTPGELLDPQYHIIPPVQLMAERAFALASDY